MCGKKKSERIACLLYPNGNVEDDLFKEGMKPAVMILFKYKADIVKEVQLFVIFDSYSSALVDKKMGQDHVAFMVDEEFGRRMAHFVHKNGVYDTSNFARFYISHVSQLLSACNVANQPIPVIFPLPLMLSKKKIDKDFPHVTPFVNTTL
jgi:hypothetical protein